MDKHKLILPVSILLGCIILGGFFFTTQVIKQKSIERQQRFELQAKVEQDEVKKEQDRKEYVASRKKDCFDIYNKEKDNWNNTKGVDYNEVKDICYVIYSDYSGKKCVAPSEEIESGSYFFDYAWQTYYDCLDKQFRKEF